VYPHKKLCLFALLGLATTACNNDSNDGDTSQSNSSSTTTTVATTVKFAAAVNGQTFSCGNTYHGVGLGKGTADTYKMNDFRFYVFDAKLIKDDGSKVSLSLTQDNKWQKDNVAMLDFENGCVNGTPDLNAQVVGTVPSDSSHQYTGVCVTLGLPFKWNHIDPAAAPSPLNASGMIWSWTTGRKFLRIDGIGDPEGVKQSYVVHLGSTGCIDKDNNGSEPDSPCTFPNTKEVCFSSFNTAKDTLVADIGKVLQASNMTYNTPDTAVGCMSGNGDPECIEIMPRLGLNFTYADGVNPSVVYPAQADFFSVSKGQ